MPADFPLGQIRTQMGYPPSTTELADSIGNFLSNLMGILTVVAGLGFLFYFLICAVNWVVSGGDPKKIEASRNQIMNAVIGMVITAAAYPIIYIIGKLLGIPISDPAAFLGGLKFKP